MFYVKNQTSGSKKRQKKVGVKIASVGSSPRPLERYWEIFKIISNITSLNTIKMKI